MRLLTSDGVIVAGPQVELFKDISQVRVEFQFPEATLLKYSLAEYTLPLAEMITAKIIKK